MTFAGKDVGAGIAYRDVSVSRNGAKYQVWRSRESAKSARYSALADGAYAFRSVAVDGVGLAESSTGLWDLLVTRATKKGDSLVLSLSRSAARKAGLKTLRVSVDGRRKANLKRIPAKVTLKKLRTGGHAVLVDAAPTKGARVRDTRMVAMCPKVKGR